MTGLAHLSTLLRDSGRIEECTRLRAVPGGVSSTVAEVDGPGGTWLAKHPLSWMAVADRWYADPDRSWREAAMLELLDGHLGPVRVPRLRFFDTDRLLIGMEFFPSPARPWKDDLMAGRVDPAVATLIARAATSLHLMDAGTTPELAGPGAARLYDGLRIDPYYRTVARRRPRFAAGLRELIGETTAPDLTRTLIHGDLNPKNVLVTPDGPVLVDWELGHVGDPAFDLAMPIAHLLLKALRTVPSAPVRADLLLAARTVWQEYSGPAPRDLAARHTGGIMAARLWGKSPVDYLPGPTERALAEAVAARLLTRPGDMDAVLDRPAERGSVLGRAVEARPRVALPGHLGDPLGHVVELESQGPGHHGVHDVERGHVGELDDLPVRQVLA